MSFLSWALGRRVGTAESVAVHSPVSAPASSIIYRIWGVVPLDGHPRGEPEKQRIGRLADFRGVKMRSILTPRHSNPPARTPVD